ncbi:ricin-type beta-trefoil lectin domain protein [Catenulispora pinisilvae]|uniref:ricin-type beta-trefoil lectin domain protein n=1 Tax=Catenulispora pinisilvae TaxID=2705253 RepID=UPI001891874E|nr:ricin-type beta-trefoil lectin domain protein [Catenulispora pinisilvae]
MEAQNKIRAAASAQAKETGKSVPVPELTTEHATTLANPDGTFTATESITPQRALINNTWTAIDTTLATGSDGVVRPKAAVDDIAVSGGGTGPLASVETGGKSFTITWPLGPLPSPQLVGSDATYPSVLPGVDLKITASAEGISEILIVHDAKSAANPALTKLQFGVSGTGITVKTDSSGALVGTDANGQVVFKGATPLMWDSTPAPALAVLKTTTSTNTATPTSQNPMDGPTDDAKTATMPVTLSGNTATMVPDAKILTDPTTVYPVIIDPSINAGQTDFAEIRGGSQAGLSFYDGGPSNQGIDGNGSFVRAGYDAGIGGAIRALFSFDVYDTLQGLNNSSAGQTQGNYAEENSTNITGATFTVTAKGSANCSPIPAFDIYSTKAFGVPTWNSDGPQSSGAYGPTAKFLTQRSPNACGEPGQISSIDDTADVKSVYTNAFNRGNPPRAALGIRIATEDANNPYWSFYAHDNSDPALYDATLTITYVAAPYVTQASTTPALSSGAGCGPLADDGTLRQNAGYLQKNIGNQVTVGAQFSDVDGGRPIQTNYWFIDHDLDNNFFLPGPGQTTYYGNISSLAGAPQSFPGGTLTQSAGQLVEGHLYSFMPYAQDTFDSGYLNSNVANSSQECYFRVAFNAPDQPNVTAPDFPTLGNPSKAGMYATMPDATGFQIAGTTSGVNIDHFDYVLNGDSSKVGDASAGGGSVPAIVTGTALAGNGATATIPVPQGMTTFGTNTLWVRAVDKAGNQSQFTQYDFYLPGNPNAVPTLGNVTGNGVPDVVAAQPLNPALSASSTNPEHLVTYPGNSDPNAGTASYSQVTEAAPTTDAPDGVSWANTLITHRGALRGTAVDDLFAYNTISHGMYYYLNKNIFGGVMNTDQFATNQKVVIQRPVCTPSAADNYCIGYASDWSGVKAILAFGNAAGNKPGTFAGRTNFFTVEDDGNNGGNLWMFSPGPGLGQLANPVLISGSGSWLDKDLIAASDPNGGLPDLWVRDRGTGTLYQYQNKLSASNIEDPTSLGNPANRTTFPGSYPVTAYGTLSSAGNPNFKPNSSGVMTGSLTQDGPAALAAVQPDGQLKILPGSSTGPVTSAHGDWDTSRTGWTGTNGITQVNGAAVSTTSGVFESGAWNTLCMDLNNGDITPGNYVQLWNCNGLVNQNWSIFSDGTIRFTGNPSGYGCVEVGPSPGDASATMAGDPIIIGACPTAGALPVPAEHWILRASDGQHGTFNLYNPASGRCLDTLANNGQRAELFDCVDTASSPRGAQQWFTPTSTAGTQTALGAGMATSTQEPATQGTSIITSPQYYGGSAYQLAGQAVGDHYGVDYYVPYEGDYIVWAGMVTNSAYGINQLTVDSTVMPNTFNAYGSVGYGTPYWGKVHLTAGRHSFTFTSIGKDPNSTGYGIGLDYLQLQPVHSTGPSASSVVSATAGLAPLPVTVDATGSLDGATSTASLTMDFGDGTVQGPATSMQFSHTYTAPGTYTTKLTVTDADGISSTTSNGVVVSAIPTSMTSSDGTTTAPCATSTASAPTMASVTPTLSATTTVGQPAQFELRDLTDPSLAPPIAVGGTGSTGSTGPTSTLTTPTLVNGHEYGFAARSSYGAGNISPITPTCYFWAVTSGGQATPTGAAGLPFDSTMYPAASVQTWAGPVTTLTWSNGSLTLTRNSDKSILWTTGTPGSNNVLIPQYDGNLVIYSSQPTVSTTGAVTGSAVWSTNTPGVGATSVLLAVDGSLTLRKGGTVVWSAPIASHIWALNDGHSLTAADTGFVAGSPGTVDTVGVSWPGGNYATFAGTPAQIATAGPVLDTTKSFTVSAWVNLATTSTQQTMLMQQATTNSAFYLEYNGSNWQFAMPSADTAAPPVTRITSASPAAAGTWTHLIGTYDATSGRMALYVNGIPNSTGTVANSIASTNLFAMGHGFYEGVTSNRFQGSLADVQVFQQAVSDSQAATIYQTSPFAKPAVPGIAGALISGDSVTGQQICLDDLNGSLANTTTVIDVYGCNGTWPQDWQFAADGTIRVMGANPATPPNKCLDTGSGNAQGTKVTLFDCQAGNANQQWKIVPSATTPGQSSLQNPATGLCLDNTNGATGNTNPFQLWPCLDNANQHFALPTAPGQNQSAEAESLWGSATGGTMQTQTGSQYSNGAQQFLTASATGATITLNMYVANAGRYAITPLMTMAGDYGTVTLGVDGTALPLTFDGFSSSGITTEQFDFGAAVDLSAGMHAFTFTVTGANSASTGFNAGIDALILQPIEDPPS